MDYRDGAPLVKREAGMANVERDHVADAQIVAGFNAQIGVLRQPLLSAYIIGKNSRGAGRLHYHSQS